MFNRKLQELLGKAFVHVLMVFGLALLELEGVSEAAFGPTTVLALPDLKSWHTYRPDPMCGQKEVMGTLVALSG